MSTNITSDNGIELEVCSLGIAVVNHEEETETWARLTDAQRVELAAALDPGRRGLLVRLDNQAATLATYRRERDEALRKKGEMVDRAVRAERERDEWKARAEQAENARDTVATRAGQLEKRLAKVMSDYQDLEDEREEIADQFATFRAEIVAEAVKARKSAVTRAEVEKVVADWVDDAPEIVNEICDLFGVGAEQAVDPVEELAGQIETAAREAIRKVCVLTGAVAPGLDDGVVEEMLDITSESRRLAAHVLGQEASSYA